MSCDRLLEKDPVPLPSDVLLFEMVGFDEVFQHTPLDVTSAPPSPVTVPPVVAVVYVMEETAVVVSDGRVGLLHEKTHTAIITETIRSM